MGLVTHENTPPSTSFYTFWLYLLNFEPKGLHGMLVTYEHKTQAYRAVLQNRPVTHTDYHAPRKAQHTLVTRARILLLTSKGEGKDGLAVQLASDRSTVQ